MLTNGAKASRFAAVRRGKETSLHAASISTTPTPLVSPIVYQQLADAADAKTLVAVDSTALGRGLVVADDVGRVPLVSVPIDNSLVVADHPTDGISIFSDRQHRAWQEAHGELPPELLEFLQGDQRWDVRMSAWLLWTLKHPGRLWRSYAALLPRPEEASCLLCFNRQEAAELQLPSLQREAAAQAGWAEHLHGSFLSTQPGSQLARLGLSSSLELSLWAISMVRSRTFSEEVGGEALTLMVPFADLANHSFHHNTTFALARDGTSFQLRALAPISAGTEATITYGAGKPNSELLRDYGFVVPGNPHDRLDLEALLAPGQQLQQGQQGQQQGEGKEEWLPTLHAASLLEAGGFAGDLCAGDIRPVAEVAPEQRLRWQRRRTALLSLPLDCAAGGSSAAGRASRTAGSGSGSGSSSGSSSSSNSGRGFFSWPPQAWTQAGQPRPQPLQLCGSRGPGSGVAAQRAAAEQLFRALVKQLACMPSSIEADKQLAAGLSGACGAGAGAGVQAPQLPQGVAPSRLVAAVAARLEHKLVLREALTVLKSYEDWLDTSVRIAS